MSETLFYKKGFVVFLDVLGFKNMVKNDRPKIKKYLDIVYEEIEKLQKIDDKNEIKSIVISDSIILSVDAKDDAHQNINIFSNLCLFVAFVQEALSLNNIWLRGAISYGDTFFDETRKQIVGDGYINAYLLESSHAIYPRVIIDNRIIKILEQSSSTELIQKVNDLNPNNWKGNILFDWKKSNYSSVIVLNKKNSSYSFTKDIPLFIDYLGNIIELNNVNTINTLLNNIKESSYESTEIYHKFRWVANYLLTRFQNAPSNFANILEEI